MNRVFLLIGGNVGDRHSNLGKARLEIAKHTGTILKQSHIYQTAAWGIEDQPPFLNQVLLIETNLSASNLLNKILGIESEQGRMRSIRLGPRLIDIDILFYNDDIVRTRQLTIPHPHLHERLFTLVPLQEIAPHFVHPVLKKTIEELRLACTDRLAVTLLDV